MVAKIDKKNESASNEKELTQRLSIYEKRLKFLQVSIGILLYFIKEFSLDLIEIDADKFKDNIDGLDKKIKTEHKTKKLESIFGKHKKIIFSYIERLKKYLKDRESEFKGIIDILTEAMSTADADNNVFNQKIYEQSDKIEKISLLDDIKKIKVAIKKEVEEVRKTLKEKQLNDREHLSKLSKQVNSLNVELKKAKKDSLTDGLTGVYNRLGFDRKMKSLVERNSVTNAPFALLLFDIDNFKKINDTYGHLIGDRVILAITQKASELTRSDDFVARFGGDEFAVIMTGASLKNAAKKAKQLSKSISGTRYALDSENESSELAFSISIGVSAFRKGDTVVSVTDRADKGLYSAKHAGKACVVSEKELKL